MNNSGKIYEEIASDYLKNKGYRIVERNFNVPGMGEIDIIANDGKSTVFIEVKARTSAVYKPYETVNSKKRSRIIKASIAYIKKKSLSGPFRYDVISIEKTGDKFFLEHFENAFDCNEKYFL